LAFDSGPIVRFGYDPPLRLRCTSGRKMDPCLPESEQPFGTRAKQFTADLAFGQTVTVRVRDIDRYKRTVAEVILPDGRDLDQELVRAGLAWWYRQFARHDRVLAELEEESRVAR